MFLLTFKTITYILVVVRGLALLLQVFFFYLLREDRNKMNLIRGKYRVFQKRNIITVSVNEGYVTEARVINKHSDGNVEEAPRVVTVHKVPPKVDYREEQPSKHKLHLGNEKLDDFLLGLYVGVVLALLLVAWLY